MLRRRANGGLVAAVVLVAVALIPASAFAARPAGSPMTSDPPFLQSIDLTDGKTLWTADLGSRPGIVKVAGATDGVVVVVEYPCDAELGATAVSGFDANTGKRRWRMSTRSAYGLNHFGGSPVDPALGVSARGVVWIEYRSSDDLRVRSVDPRSGDELWETRGSQADSWPLAGNRDIVVLGPHPNLINDFGGNPSATIRALDRRTGKELWQSEFQTTGARSLGAATTNDVVVANVDNRLQGLDVRTGHERWSVDLPVPDGAYNQARLGAAGPVAIVTQDAGVSRFATSGVDATNGQVLWSGSNDIVIQQPKPAGPDTLAVTIPSGQLDGSASLTVSRFDAQTATHVWTVPSSGFFNGLAPMSTKTFAVLPRDQALAVLNFADGSELRSIAPSARTSSGVIAGRRLYLAGGCRADPEQGG